MDDFQEAVTYVRDFISREIVNVYGQKYARLDNRNHFLVVCQSLCPTKFVEYTTKYRMTVGIPDENGKTISYIIISEKDWSLMEFESLDDSTEATFFDEVYYRPSLKNECGSEYTWARQSHLWLERAGQIVDIFHPASVLDIGCAKGFLLKGLFHHGVKDLSGIDISQWAIDNCEPEVKGKLRQFDLTGDQLPFPDNYFDCVHSDMTLEHISAKDIPHCLAELYRVSKKWVLVGVPLGYSSVSRPFGDPTHKSIYAPGWWIKFAHEAGLLFDWRYSQFFATRVNPEFIGESARLVFVKDKLDKDCPWDKLGIKVQTL